MCLPLSKPTHDATKQVTKISYVSTTGVVSDKPFQGVNIVITQFNDGSSIVTKAVSKSLA